MAAAAPKPLKLSYRRLGNTGLKVSDLCLGAMTFGSNTWKLPAAASDKICHDMLDIFVKAGGNFIDTADIYGTSEEVIGSWLEKRTDRDSLVIATKVRGRTGPGPNDIGLSAKHIFAGCNNSLRRLKTNYIDLYQCHTFDAETPLEETLGALNDLVRSGKIRYIGVSNWQAWQIARGQEICRKNGWAPITCLQQEYNLMCRATEWDLVPVCQAEGLGVIPWSPLAGGWLTGKYKREVAPESGRVAWAEAVGWQATAYAVHNNDHTWRILDELAAISKETGKSIAQISLRWLMQMPGVTCPIIGASSIAQLEDNLAASMFELSADQMDRLKKASTIAKPYPWGFTPSL